MVVQILEATEDCLAVPPAGIVQVGQVVEQPHDLGGSGWWPAGRPCGAGLPQLEDRFACLGIKGVGVSGAGFARRVGLRDQPGDVVGEPPGQRVVRVGIA